MKLKWNRWYVFPLIAVLALTQWACGEDGFGTTGAGGDINVTGDANNLCVITADAADDNELITVDCPMNPPLAVTPENPGTSQFEPTPE